jgi:methyltransferase (TIGR00027 family)
MQDGRSSRTAAYVALLRALGDRGVTSAEGFADGSVRGLLPARWALAEAWLAAAVPRLPARARARVAAHVDLLVCRSLAIDAELEAAMRRGASQVVVLGAGFDDRAHRMIALRDAHVFEVDHPATQSVKRRRAAALPRTYGALTYVGCDFERDALGERLAAAGHRAGAPTAWIWEGVTLYLGDDAIRETLAAIAARSAATSTLVVEYHDIDAPTPMTAYTVTRRLLLALWSEPHIGLRSRATMHAELTGAGLRVEGDFGVSAWGAAFAGAKPSHRPSRARLAIATR